MVHFSRKWSCKNVTSAALMVGSPRRHGSLRANLLDGPASNGYIIKDRRIDDEAYCLDFADDSGTCNLEFCWEDLWRYHRRRQAAGQRGESGCDLRGHHEIR